jgi:HemY protein
MKFSIVVVIATLIFAFAAHFLLEDPGYVAINFRGYLVEMSVPVLLGIFVSLVFAVWAIRKVIIAPRLIGEAAGRYRAGRAGEKLTRGMIEVAEGNFARGEKLLARAASTSDAPLFNYLQAARAAHLQGSDSRRDEWLRLAYEHTPAAANAVLLTQAELQLDRGQYEQALATLRRIDEDSRDHSYALALLGRLYYRLGDWDHLADILPRLKKHGRVTQEKIDEWTIRVHREMLGRAADADGIAAAWKQVPKNLRSNIEVLDAYFSALIRTGQHEAAEKAIVASRKSEWRGPIVRLFGLVEGANASNHLKRAELWLSDHGDDPDLLLTAARLCLRNELWGKARSYLESVITLRPTPEAYQEYGRLLNKLGESDAAAEAFREGLGLVAEIPKPAIPHLAPDSQ